MAEWTPIKHTVITADAQVANKYFAGIVICTNGTSSTTHVRDGTTVGSTIAFTFIVEAVTNGTTRAFPMPGLVVMNTGSMYIDVDSNVTRATVLHG